MLSRFENSIFLTGTFADATDDDTNAARRLLADSCDPNVQPEDKSWRLLIAMVRVLDTRSTLSLSQLYENLEQFLGAEERSELTLSHLKTRFGVSCQGSYRLFTVVELDGDVNIVKWMPTWNELRVPDCVDQLDRVLHTLVYPPMEQPHVEPARNFALSDIDDIFGHQAFASELDLDNALCGDGSEIFGTEPEFCGAQFGSSGSLGGQFDTLDSLGGQVDALDSLGGPFGADFMQIDESDLPPFPTSPLLGLPQLPQLPSLPPNPSVPAMAAAAAAAAAVAQAIPVLCPDEESSKPKPNRKSPEKKRRRKRKSPPAVTSPKTGKKKRRSVDPNRGDPTKKKITTKMVVDWIIEKLRSDVSEVTSAMLREEFENMDVYRNASLEGMRKTVYCAMSNAKRRVAAGLVAGLNVSKKKIVFTRGDGFTRYCCT